MRRMIAPPKDQVRRQVDALLRCLERAQAWAERSRQRYIGAAVLAFLAGGVCAALLEAGIRG